MTDSSNTAQNSKRIPGQPFVKGDPRIWRHGRPKSFDALRELAQQIAHETAKAGGNVVIIDGHTATVSEVILRQWAQSKNPQLQQKFIEVAFGKVPSQVELSGAVANVEMSLSDWRAHAERQRGEAEATLAIDDSEDGAAGE